VWFGEAGLAVDAIIAIPLIVIRHPPGAVPAMAGMHQVGKGDTYGGAPSGVTRRSKLWALVCCEADGSRGLRLLRRIKVAGWARVGGRVLGGWAASGGQATVKLQLSS